MNNNPWRQIYDCIGEAAALEMLAEEAAELAAAASKAARIVRGDNPARMDLDTACKHVSEEIKDVMNAIDVLAAGADVICKKDLENFKMNRWYQSLFKEESP